MSFLNKLFGIKSKNAYKKGIHFYNHLKYAEAIECLEQMMSEKTLSNSIEFKLSIFYCSRAYRNLGIVQFTQKNNKKALSYFQRGLQLSPKDNDLNYFIGICLNNIGDFHGAMESFSKFQHMEPGDIPIKLKMAIIFHNLEMWDNAEEIHRNLLKKNPNFADIHFHLGLSLMRQGKKSKAIESFQNALRINPDYTRAQLQLGITQAVMGQHEDAFATLGAIIIKNPSYADVYYLIGIIKEECNETEEAITYLQKAIHISPKFKNALVKLTIFYCQLGKIDAAKKQIQEAVQFYPKDKRLNSIKKFIKASDPSSKLKDHISNGIKHIFKNDLSFSDLRNEFHKGLDIMPSFSEIIAMFNSSKYAQEDAGISDFLIPFILEQIEQNPTYPDLYNSLGSQLLFCKKNLEAEKAFAKAVELNPGYVTARINLLKTLQKNAKHEEAYEHGKVLLSKNLPFPDVYYTIAEVLIDLKLYDKALINAQKVLKLSPYMISTNLLIARIHEIQGDYDLAMKEINKCLSSDTDPKVAVDAKALLEKLEKKIVT